MASLYGKRGRACEISLDFLFLVGLVGDYVLVIIILEWGFSN